MAMRVLDRMMTMGRAATCGLALSSVIALGACANAGSGVDQTTPLPVQEAHPITAEMRTFSVLVPIDEVSGARQLLPADFVAEYHRRGRGPMTIYLPSDGMAVNAARAVGGYLAQQAVPVKALSGEDDNGMIVPGMLVVTYQAYVATVPECGLASSSLGMNPANQSETNYGCAIQRNIGLMVSDPGDMVRPRTAETGDTARATDVITKYRSGSSTGAGTQSGETIGIDVGN